MRYINLNLDKKAAFLNPKDFEQKHNKLASQNKLKKKTYDKIEK